MYSGNTNSRQCRAFLSPWIDPKTGKKKVVGRNNAGATSINLPRIAIKHKGDLKGFYKELDELLELCKENSIFRMNYIKNAKASTAPILWEHGGLAELQPEETIEQFLFNGYTTISIGYIGLSEVSELIFGTNFAFDENVYKECLAIVQYMKDKCIEYKEETGIGFALYSTPSESLCYRFEKIDLEEFGLIEGITDKGYYDNSFHVSSKLKIDPFEKIRLEAPFHEIASGGHISYLETDSLKKNIDALDKIVKYARSVKLHYFGVNQPVDNCHECGFKGEFLATEKGFECPQCGNHDSSKMNVIRRVCGYLSSPNAQSFNKGKQKEVINRVKHLKNNSLIENKEV